VPASEQREAWTDSDVVRHNLQVLEVDMAGFVAPVVEIGDGDAGYAEIEGQVYRCVAVNGYANSATGEVLRFSHAGELPSGAAGFRMRAAFNDDKEVFRVVELWVDEFV
jgi:hypothetical protein